MVRTPYCLGTRVEKMFSQAYPKQDFLATVRKGRLIVELQHKKNLWEYIQDAARFLATGVTSVVRPKTASHIDAQILMDRDVLRNSNNAYIRSSYIVANTLLRNAKNPLIVHSVLQGKLYQMIENAPAQEATALHGAVEPILYNTVIRGFNYPIHSRHLTKGTYGNTIDCIPHLTIQDTKHEIVVNGIHFTRGRGWSNQEPPKRGDLFLFDEMYFCVDSLPQFEKISRQPATKARAQLLRGVAHLVEQAHTILNVPYKKAQSVGELHAQLRRIRNRAAHRASPRRS